MPYFFVTLLIFSSMEVVSKPLMPFVDPFQLTFHRFLVGLIFLFLFLVARGRCHDLIRIGRHDMLLLAFLGFLNTFFAMSMLQAAVKNSTAATAATVICANPLFVYLFSLVTGDESFSWRRIAGIVAGMIGIALVMFDQGLRFDVGVLYALAAAAAFALYTLLNKPVARRIGSLPVNIVSFSFGILLSAVYLLVTGVGVLPPLEVTNEPARLAAFLYLGVVVSGIGYVTFVKTIRALTPVAASVIFIVKPALATLFAVMFLGERLSALFWPGLLFVVLGGLLILRNAPSQKVDTH
ncbi:MAG TPA: EamA family transporter [bacterium]|nr:EamA family transporter [bacterium]